MPFFEASPTPATRGHGASLLLRVDGARHRVTVAAGTTVAPRPSATEVPHAPAWLLGIVLYEGDALPLVDLRCALDGEPARAGAPARARMLVTRAAGCALACAVDDVDADDGAAAVPALDLDALAWRLLAQVGAPWPAA